MEGKTLLVPELIVPSIVLPNMSFMGDTVLLEPIARHLAIRNQCYILSKFPELLIGHPMVKGISSSDQIPEGSRILDLSTAISNIEKNEDGERVVLGEKNRRMWLQAGFKSVMDHPKLFLTATEWHEVKSMKSWFQRPCIGVVLRTRHRAKDWAYMMMFIRHLILSKKFDVFVFAKGVGKTTTVAMPPGVHYFLNMPLRKVMQGLSMMDVVVSADTGLAHISSALGTQTLVVCFSLFEDLYPYPNTTTLGSDNYTMRKGILGISVKRMLQEVDRHLLLNKGSIPIAPETDITSEQQHLLFIRFRGLGDAILSLAALATFKKLNPNIIVTYLTSPGIGSLVKQSNVVDHVIEMQYNHATSGLPLPPDGIDYAKFDTVINAINAIDFGPESAEVHRTVLFAELLGLDQVDYSTDWKFEIPKSWIELAERKLKQHGVTGKTIIMQADSKGLSRIWHRKRQDEFVGIARKKGYTVVAVSDEEHKYPASVVNLTGKLSFIEYVGMIGAGDILLSPDSGGLHIAGVTDQLALGLFGSVLPELRVNQYSSVEHIVGKASCVPCNDWQMANCSRKKNWPMCMWSIKPQQVMRKIEQMLKGARANG